MIRFGAGTKKCWKRSKLSINKNIYCYSPHKYMFSEDKSKILLNWLMQLEAQLCAFFFWENPV